MKNGRYIEGDLTSWYLNDRLHREDGPAIEYHEYNEWYQNGELHREDGPAVEYSDGHKNWYLYGNSLEKEEFDRWLDKKNLNEKLNAALSPRERKEIKKI